MDRRWGEELLNSERQEILEELKAKLALREVEKEKITFPV